MSIVEKSDKPQCEFINCKTCGDRINALFNEIADDFLSDFIIEQVQKKLNEYNAEKLKIKAKLTQTPNKA
jgi:hypothetical protein